MTNVIERRKRRARLDVIVVAALTVAVLAATSAGFIDTLGIDGATLLGVVTAVFGVAVGRIIGVLDVRRAIKKEVKA